jgi:hypothetical protein
MHVCVFVESLHIFFEGIHEFLDHGVEFGGMNEMLFNQVFHHLRSLFSHLFPMNCTMLYLLYQLFHDQFFFNFFKWRRQHFLVRSCVTLCSREKIFIVLVFTLSSLFLT